MAVNNPGEEGRSTAADLGAPASSPALFQEITAVVTIDEISRRGRYARQGRAPRPATDESETSLLFRAGKNCLKMRRLFLARHHADFDFFESGAVQPSMQIALREAKPPVTIGIVGLFKTMLQQVQD